MVHDNPNVNVNNTSNPQECREGLSFQKSRVSSSLKCLYTNADFLHNKIELIEIYAQNNNVDVIAITEIHDKFANKDQKLMTKFSLPGFNSFQVNEGRGVLLLVKDKLKVNWNVWLKIKIHSQGQDAPTGEGEGQNMAKVKIKIKVMAKVLVKFKVKIKVKAKI